MVKRVLIGLLCLVVVAALAGTVVGRVALSPQVHSVDETQMQQRAWANHTVLVRGWVNGGGGMPCALASSVPCAATGEITWARLIPAPGAPWGARELDVVLPSGARPNLLVARVTISPLMHVTISPLMHVPILGPLLFAQASSLTLRVRLMPTSPTCLHAAGPCADGLLIP